MALEHFLFENKSAILKKWADTLFHTYPGDAIGFFEREKDRFANPVGYTLSKELENLYNLLIQEEFFPEKIKICLDNIIRIRAVQDFMPSQAVGFVLEFKDIVRRELEKVGASSYAEALAAFEKKIDKVALMAFDIYSLCKQKIYDIRVGEVKRQVSRLLERANLVCEIPDVSEDL